MPRATAAQRKAGLTSPSKMLALNARRDPTGTGSIRRAFETDIVNRFRRLQRAIWEIIVERRGFESNFTPVVVNADGLFAFPRSDDKIAAFMAWLAAQENLGILETIQGVPISRAAAAAWTAVYIQHAYRQGVINAGHALRVAGVDVSDRWIDSAFFRPIHADRIGLAYTRAFTDLRGITAAMDAAISRILAEGLARGANPRVMAKQINDEVENIGIRRARTLARTEVVRAHHQAQINAYEEAGVEGVTVMAEWDTAHDSRVCPRCASMQGKVFTLAQIRNLIPAHPNCRCAAIPKVIHAKGLILE